MKYFYSVLISAMVIITAFTATAQEVEVELKGLYLASEPKHINSPWGPLGNKMLLLNNPQRISRAS